MISLDFSVILQWFFRDFFCDFSVCDLWSESMTWRDHDGIFDFPPIFTYNRYFLMITTRREVKPWSEDKMLTLFSLCHKKNNNNMIPRQKNVGRKIVRVKKRISSKNIALKTKWWVETVGWEKLLIKKEKNSRSENVLH